MAASLLSMCRVRAYMLLISILFIASSSASITSQFKSFYPQHGPKYEYLLRHNCSQQYANYLTGRPQDFQLDWLGGGGPKTVLVQPVVKCLLDNISEYIKAASSSAQVILGVTPPILATLGSSTDELAVLSLIGRKPFLSFLVSYGSPAVYAERIFGFRQPEKALLRNPGQYKLEKPDAVLQRYVLLALEYAIAGAAVANIAELNWELGLKTVCCWWSETVLAPLIWTILAVPIHIGGMIAVRLRVHRIYSDEDTDEPKIGVWEQISRLPHQLPVRVFKILRDEWTPITAPDAGIIRIKKSPERKIYIAWTWFLSTAIVIHLLFGSLVLSGLLFIGPRDALFVIFRYLLSVLACRAIVNLELAGMRGIFNTEDDEGQELRVLNVETRPKARATY